MTQPTKTKNQILAVIITIAALLTGANAWSASKFTIEKTDNSFVIKRSSDVGSETVYYRTVSLSAIHGQHFTSINGSFTFKDGKKESPLITVEEITPKIAAFYFQEDYTRQYRFEVLNEGGFQVASADRTMTIGSKVTKDAFNIKDVTVNSGTITVTDGGYSQDYHAVPLDEYYTKAAAKDYLVAAGAELRMTLTFQAKESDDGYQHLQILVNRPKIPKVTNYDTGAGDNNPGKIQYSNYMACFVHEGGKKNSSYANYSFPVLSVGATSSTVSGAWSDINSTNDVGELRCQKFNVGCRATDGRLIVCSKNALKDLSYLGIRFDASGDFGDTWTANNTEAHIQAIDKTAPTVLYDYITVSGGRHSKGNTIYVSVPFSEIVNVYGSTNQTYLDTSWGRLYYYNGKGCNVLTFAGTINTDATGTFSIKGYKGTIKDMRSNQFVGTISKDFDISLDPNYTFSIGYDLAEGNLSSPNPTTYDYETPTFTLINPTKFGNVFKGWKEANSNIPMTTLIIPKGSNGHRYYTAQWTQNPYTVRFHKNDGTDETADEVFAYGTAQQLDEPFTRTGYSFTGWSATPDGAVVYTAGQEVNNLTSIADEVIDLYAQWSVHTYTVHFDANGGNGTMSDMTFTYGQERALTPNAFTRGGNDFTGWNTQADGEGTAYANGQNVSNLTSDDDVTITLYAQWKINIESLWTGAGTQDDPFVITTPEGLDYLASCVNGSNYLQPFSFQGYYFKLGADIDYNYDAPWYEYDYLENNYTPIGSYYNYDKTGFEGIFDGNYKTISGIRIKNQDLINHIGLFGYVGPGGVVKNVTLSDACIVGLSDVGGIAGAIDESAMIDNCHVTNTVAICSAQYDGQVFGGITGYNNYGIVNGCTSAANIGVNYPPIAYVGGVVGYNGGVLMNSTAIDANVNSFYYVGGVVGGNTGILQHCHTVRTYINGTNFVGAICGADAFTFYNKQEGFPPVANYYCDCSVMFKNSVKTYEIGCGNSDVPPFDIPDYDGAVPAIVLYDDDKNPNLEQKNTDIITYCNSYEGNLVVYGRKLWKDGDWNTLCLPFNVTAEQMTAPQNPLYGAIIKELDNESSYEGHQTGLDNDGTLRLYFKTATSIEAGKPYLVRWPEVINSQETINYLGRYFLPWYEGTEILNDPLTISAYLGAMFNYPLLSENPNYAAQAPSSDILPLKSIVNPAFSGVTVSSTTPTAVSFAGGKFVGNYSSVAFGANDKSILYLGAENKLYWPNADMTLKACRAYFDLGTNEARQFVLHFDGETTEVPTMSDLRSKMSDVWYDLQGRRLSQKPTKAGMYIHGQKKVMIK